jgi:hypothetical protein
MCRYSSRAWRHRSRPNAETGNYWGYSYIRLRGIDQSRINLTLDGIRLNDPEDQVLYFADFPDLAKSLSSVQVQRGVGTSSNGTAAFAGSINMESAPDRLVVLESEGRRQPETVHDVEAGATYRGARVDAQANAYSMDFRNEIEPIGGLSYLGNPLRKNAAEQLRQRRRLVLLRAAAAECVCDGEG